MPQIEMTPITALRGYERNARTHSPEQVQQLVASIREFGFTNPVLVTADGMIVAGHGRIEAAKAAGLADVPTLVVGKDWSSEKVRAYVLADNQLAANAGWDRDILRAELANLKDVGFDIGVIGFDAPTIDDLFAERTEGLTDPDEVPEPPAEPVSQIGDLWVLGKHRIICGDSTDAATVARLLGDEKPHLMVTDPPYGVKYDATWRGKAGLNPMGANRTGLVAHDDNADWREAWALFPGNIVYVWHGGLHSAVVAESLVSLGYNLRAQIIWNKAVMAMSRGDYHWKHEPCWYAVKGTGNWAGDRKQTTVWDIPSPIHIMGGSKEEKTKHPTQKPVECMKRPIENNSKPSDAVYEPFSGSGTTIIAGEMTGRRVFAIELNPQYVDVAVERWQKFTGQKATLESTGETFAETKAIRHMTVSSDTSLTAA